MHSPARNFLLLLCTLLLGIQFSSALSQLNVSHVYLFLREEETPIGKAILSASRAFYLAKTYAKRGISSVVIEELFEVKAPESGYPEAVYTAAGENAFLRLDRNTGLLETQRSLDLDDPQIFEEGCRWTDAESTTDTTSNDEVERGFLPHTAEHCCFPLQIENSQMGAVKVDICIKDINDNAPTWNLGSTRQPSDEFDLKIDIPENVPIGTVTEVPCAVDSDWGQNRAIRYEMWPLLPAFELLWNETTGKLSIVIMDSVDREKQSLYSISITAIDGGIQPKTGTLEVGVVVQDVNDNDPVFESPKYSVNIGEDTTPSSFIIKINATDADVGRNAEVVYVISSLTDPEVIRMFSIEKTTGWIRLESELDFENTRQLSLTIEASDLGDPQRQSICTLEIVILDVNDNAPQLIFEPGSLTNFALVPENEIPGRTVAVFTVLDEDSEENGEIVCSKTAVFRDDLKETVRIGNRDDVDGKDTFTQDPIDFFKLELMDLPFSKVYQLSTAVSFDREEASTFHVNITCSDRGTPVQTTQGVVLVRVLDVNDHEPVFSSNHFTLRVPESHAVNTTLLTLQATDLDEGENGTITYHLLLPDDSLISIDSKTGEVVLREPLDYEEWSQYNFTVLATDGGEPSRTGSIEVTIFVDDTNDNAPTVTSALQFSVPENHPATQSMGTVTAVDYDTGLNGNVFFKIASIKPCFCGVAPMSGEKNVNESFCSWATEMSNKCDIQSVDQSVRLCSRSSTSYASQWTSKEYRRFLMTETGDIYLRYPNLDRESVPVYMVQGAAIDRGNPPQKTAFCVTVVVNDINDCHPKFIFPALTKNTVVVRLPIIRGEPIIQLHATDYDILENGDLRFDFSEDSEPAITGLFAIHAYSGLIVSQYSLQPKDLDFLGPSAINQTHTIKLKACDMGTPSLVSYATIRLRFHVRVDYADVNFPTIGDQQMQQQNSGLSVSDLFNEQGGAQINHSHNPSEGRTNSILITFCILFLVVLLFLATIVLFILGRRSAPQTPSTRPINHISPPLLMPPNPPHYLRHHPLPNDCYQREDSWSTMPAKLTLYHRVLVTPTSTPIGAFGGSGNLSLDSSTV